MRTMTGTVRFGGFALAAAATVSLAAVSFAQPAQPPFAPPPGGRATTGQLPPGARPGRAGMPPGHPGFGGPNGRPFPPRPGSGPPPRPQPTHATQAEEPEEPEHAEHCPGHGPLDPPPPPNFWHGMLGVDNDKAQTESTLNKLLWRYENKLDPCDAKNEPPPYLAAVLNFLILIGILVKFGKKPLSEALVARRAAIMREIDTATQLREEAEARLEEYQQKLDNLEQTLEEVRLDFAARTENEQKRILAEAEERRVRMTKDAVLRIEQELKEARARLLEEAVEGAVRTAEGLLASGVGSSDQERLADEYLAGISTSMKSSAADELASAHVGGAS